MNKALYLLMITLTSMAVAQPQSDLQLMNEPPIDERTGMITKPRVWIWAYQHTPQKVYHLGEDIPLYVSSNQNYYIYLFHVNSKGQVTLLPSKHYSSGKTQSYLRANTIQRLSHINRVTKSLGMHRIFVVASDKRLYSKTINHLTSISSSNFSNTLKSLTYQGIITTDMLQYQITKSAQQSAKPRKMNFLDFAAQHNVFLYGFGQTKWVTACNMGTYQSPRDFNRRNTKECLWHAPKGWIIIDTKVNVLNNTRQNVSWSSNVIETNKQHNGLLQQTNKINNLIYIAHQQGKKNHALYFQNIKRHILRERSKYSPHQNSFSLTTTIHNHSRRSSNTRIQGHVKLMKIE